MRARISRGINIEEGKHTGTIARFEERETPFHYIDVYVKFAEGELKTGFPATLSVTSKLGKFLTAMGVDVTRVIAGKKDEVDITSILQGLVGKKVTALVTRDTRGFLRIVDGSIKPVA